MSVARKPKGFSSIAIASGVLALVAALAATFIAPLHAFRATSGYSGHSFWLGFHSAPTERQIYEAVFLREPSLSLGNDRLAEVQEARKSFKPGFPHGDLCMAPFSPDESPDVVFDDGTRVKAVWLTEPSTRTTFPVFIVWLSYFTATSAASFLAALIALLLIRWVWYFVLDRVSELSGAIKHSE